MTSDAAATPDGDERKPKPYRGGCTPGMRRRPDGQGCRRDCLHRQLVTEYQWERMRWEERRESGELAPTSVPGIAGSQVAMHQLEDADYRAAFPPPTFRQWLIDHAGQRTDPDA